MPNCLSPRRIFCLGFFSTLILLGIAFYFQFSEGLEPCPLCISQRLAVVLVGLVMGVAALHNPGAAGIRIYAFLSCGAALLGASISARHIYIQHLPADQVPACGPGLAYMFQYFPLGETLKAMVSGTGDCAHVDWTLWGYSMPVWVLLAFIGLALGSLLPLWNLPKQQGLS